MNTPTPIPVGSVGIAAGTRHMYVARTEGQQVSISSYSLRRHRTPLERQFRIKEILEKSLRRTPERVSLAYNHTLKDKSSVAEQRELAAHEADARSIPYREYTNAEIKRAIIPSDEPQTNHALLNAINGQYRIASSKRIQARQGRRHANTVDRRLYAIALAVGAALTHTNQRSL